TADCGPVLFADETAGVIAVAHAGWRGAATGVLEATIAAMERCGADRERVAVALGPTIRQPNYEVGPEFVARFKAEDGANERFFRASARPQHALFDLPGYIAARLAAAGIRRVEDLGHCTYADATRFFSYRRSTHRNEPDYGRHVNPIAPARQLRFRRESARATNCCHGLGHPLPLWERVASPRKRAGQVRGSLFGRAAPLTRTLASLASTLSRKGRG